MRKEVNQYVCNCHNCQWFCSAQHSMCGVCQPVQVPGKPWDHISMNFIVGSTECEGFVVIWVVVDRLSKMWHFVPYHTATDSTRLAKLFINKVLCLRRLPLRIDSHWGPQFALRFWGQLCSHLGFEQRMSTAFHPKTDGQTEQIKASMEQ